jgi:hypothetical protein
MNRNDSESRDKTNRENKYFFTAGYLGASENHLTCYTGKHRPHTFKPLYTCFVT